MAPKRNTMKTAPVKESEQKMDDEDLSNPESAELEENAAKEAERLRQHEEKLEESGELSNDREPGPATKKLNKVRQSASAKLAAEEAARIVAITNKKERMAELKRLEKEADKMEKAAKKRAAEYFEDEASESECEAKASKKAKNEDKKMAKKETKEEKPKDDAPRKRVKMDSPDTGKFKYEDKKDFQPSYDDLLKLVAQLQSGIIPVKQPNNDLLFPKGVRCMDCEAIFKSAPTAIKGDSTQTVSENKIQTALGPKVKGIWTKKYASIPCRSCLKEILSRLEKVARMIIEKAKQGVPHYVAELALLAPISTNLAKGKSLSELVDRKCELFSYEEFNDGVYMRVCFQNGTIDATTKLVQHYRYNEGSWEMADHKDANMFKKGDTFSKLAAFKKAILGSDNVPPALGDLIASHVLSENFAPPAPVSVVKDAINFEELEF